MVSEVRDRVAVACPLRRTASNYPPSYRAPVFRMVPGKNLERALAIALQDRDRVQFFQNIILSLAMLFTLSATAFAAETHETENSNFSVTAPTFPDAYIITETTPAVQTMAGGDTIVNLGSVSATVFVEETYDMVDGKLAVTDSRLLSKAEVNEFGIDNFIDLNTTAVTPRAATNSKGKLTITFSGTYRTSGTSVSCDLTGNAHWAGWDMLGGNSNMPAVGEDFLGITWSGGFTGPTFSASGTDSKGDSISVTNVDSIANGGRVWSFDDLIYGNRINYYAKDVDVDMTIKKNTMTGQGNTAEAVLKYIHTYSSVNGSIEFSAGTDSVSAGFTLSSTSNQWPLVCTVTNIPY